MVISWRKILILNKPLITSNFLHYQQQQQDRLQVLLQQQLQNSNSAAPLLAQAMAYSVFNGGKRVRPLLVYATLEALGASAERGDAPACAIEFMHCYSLIHDDLPAMDDDDLRRGQPTCHIRFDEATAILAGDALQCLSFETLTEAKFSYPAQTRLALLSCLATASGQRGMVAGQSIDLASVNQSLDLAQLKNLHKHKTGALISAAVELGAIASEVCEPKQQQLLQRYGEALGLAFQVVDDIIDVSSDTATLGKTQGADAALNKPTFVSLLGMAAAKETAKSLIEEALDAVSSFGPKAVNLQALAGFVLERQF